MPQSAPEQSKPRRPHARRIMQELCHDPAGNQALDLLARRGRMILQKRT
jgi:hypothetical protein